MKSPFWSLSRTAGLVYLTVVLSGIVTLAYVPSQLIEPEDPARTVANIMASEHLFRVGILAGFICFTAFLLLPLVLYRLLGHINRTAGVLMIAFAVVSVPISLANMSNKFDVLILLGDEALLGVLAPDQLNAAVMLSLAQYNRGLLASALFWGLWLFPLGYLILKSGALPRVLGVLLIAGCFGYLVQVFGAILFASYADTIIARYATLPASLGEIGTCLWLLIMGAKVGPGERTEPTQV
jgi:hypothetical protein